ncbi:unnamed protein product [Orchesella dallaii]|uniref:DUF4789 domain-containing protein n=1 Tax=Orchesella dallaii TaxID=48710 RepID=A0ABP1QA43_9HEXA
MQMYDLIIGTLFNIENYTVCILRPEIFPFIFIRSSIYHHRQSSSHHLRVSHHINMTLNSITTLALITILIEAALVLSIEAKSVPQEIVERIVTDPQILWTGAPIDYSYNESHIRSDPSDGFSSVPGCPKSDEGYPWVYFGLPPKCYLTGQKGPCGAYLSLFAKKGTPFGFCNCDCFQDLESGENENKDQDRFCKGSSFIEFVYMPAVGKCFALYYQGPCKGDEWLVKVAEGVNNTNAIAKCETRKCPEGVVPYGDDEDGKPYCSGRVSAYAPVTIIPRKECIEMGMRYSELLKKCVKRYKLNFV